MVVYSVPGDKMLPVVPCIVLTLSNIVAGDSKRRIVHIAGDLLLGGLFPMHEQVEISEVHYLRDNGYHADVINLYTPENSSFIISSN